MALSPEDTLRLNVLLANQPQAIRIDQSRMVVHALSAQGEAKIVLKPNCSDEQYIKQIKELLSGHILGSPGGYPVYLQRWTRMGQMRDDSLEQLLLLGEPEAVVAAVCAPGLTEELARRAWWAMEDAENARQMLHKTAICQSGMGKVLANYLVEHLPFETESDKQIETIRLILQPGLIDEHTCTNLWHRAARKPIFYVGFIAARPDQIPSQAQAHPIYAQCVDHLESLADAGNLMAELLRKIFSPTGQAYLQTLLKILHKPSDQYVVNATLDQIALHFSPLRHVPADDTLDELIQEATEWIKTSNDAQTILELRTDLTDAIQACRVLSGMSYGVVRPILKDTTAIGSLMRKKLSPIMEGLHLQLAHLTPL